MHLTQDEIEDFVTGRCTSDARRRVVRHLVTRCAVCRHRLLRGFPLLSAKEIREIEPPMEVDGYDAAIDRAREAVRPVEERWRAERTRLIEALEVAQGPRGWEGISIQRTKSLAGWPLVELRLCLSFAARYSDPAEMEKHADYARQEAERICPAEYGEGFLADVRARAWAEYANALRVNEKYDEAESALARARSHIENGDLLIKARVADIEASLRRAQRRFTEGVRQADEAFRGYCEIGERHLAGRALINKGICLYMSGRPAGAVDILQEGLALVAKGRDRQLIAAGHQALVNALVDSGRLAEAGKLLLESGLRQAYASQPLNLLRLRWVEAKIQAGLGKLESAERAFLEVREGFFAAGLEYDEALVGIDLAALWLRQGKVAQARELGEEVNATFEWKGIPREATEAFRFFYGACRLEAASVDTAERIRGFLGRLNAEPNLRFEPEELFA